MSARVNLTQEEGGECIDHSINVGRNVAEQLQLRNDRRYRVEFDTNTREMRFFLKPVTRARLPLRIGTEVVEDPNAPEPRIITLRNNQIFVSAIGRVTLGIIGDTLLLQHGLKKKSLHIINGTDIFLEPFVQVTPKTAEQLGLRAGNAIMEFNQNTSILRINPGK
ncbi:hypothetical protein DL346_03175 [Paenibacillus montanisoli]|uniref:Uncharacterized protein n=2 Tax=Paenibacillus montanisoli TaxID=2081970 RepID=A0A328UBX4_9BACL|nr:hypothetical protein DL346_03175 [Paenibacillus montanisoli]